MGHCYVHFAFLFTLSIASLLISYLFGRSYFRIPRPIFLMVSRVYTQMLYVNNYIIIYVDNYNYYR